MDIFAVSQFCPCGKPHAHASGNDIRNCDSAKTNSGKPYARELQPIFAESQFLVSTAANPTCASCTSGKIFPDVEDGQTPRARAAPESRPLKVRELLARQTPRATVSSGNVSLTRLPHARESCTRRWQHCHRLTRQTPRVRAAQRIPEVATFPLRGKPHARAAP